MLCYPLQSPLLAFLILPNQVNVKALDIHQVFSDASIHRLSMWNKHFRIDYELKFECCPVFFQIQGLVLYTWSFYLIHYQKIKKISTEYLIDV